MWKDVFEYENLYEVNEYGVVRRKGKTEELKGFVNKDGYVVLSLCKNGVAKKVRRNRLVATAFVPNENNYPFVNHKDEIKTNDNADNLEWCTHSYNVKYGTGVKRASEKKYKPVARIDNDGNVIIYQSLTLASKENNIDIKQISQSIIRKNKCCGYEWYYATYSITR